MVRGEGTCRVELTLEFERHVLIIGVGHGKDEEVAGRKAAADARQISDAITRFISAEGW